MILKCFEISRRTVDRKGKRVICEFVNQVCGTEVGDVSVEDDQCESIIGAIIVCFLCCNDISYLISFRCVLVLLCCPFLTICFVRFRMAMRIQYDMKLE